MIFLGTNTGLGLLGSSIISDIDSSKGEDWSCCFSEFSSAGTICFLFVFFVAFDETFPKMIAAASDNA